MSDPCNLFISAGEASGEAYGALLIEALKKRLGDAGRQTRFFGMGGERMAEAGLERIVRAEDVAVMGITEVIRHLPRIYREFRRLKQSIRQRRPDVAVLIDFPDIHFKLAEELHRLGIPVIFFVSPQLWAWKKHRIELVRKYVDRMLVIFPFEEPFYRERGIAAEYVGHPLADQSLPTISRQEFASLYDLNPAQTWIGLLPGSRAKEIRANLPELLAAARLLVDRARSQPEPRPGYVFLLPLAPTLTREDHIMVSGILRQHGSGLTVRIIQGSYPVGAVCPFTGAALDTASPAQSGPSTGGARDALFHARASIVASGTATVEAALMGNPFVVVYRVSPITYAIARRVVSVPHVAMVNLIAGNRIVPELIQNDFTASNIVQQLEPLLPDGPPRQSMMQELQQVRGLLSTGSAVRGERGGAIDRVAAITLEFVGVPSPIAENGSTIAVSGNRK